MRVDGRPLQSSILSQTGSRAADGDRPVPTERRVPADCCDVSFGVSGVPGVTNKDLEGLKQFFLPNTELQ